MPANRSSSHFSPVHGGSARAYSSTWLSCPRTRNNAAASAWLACASSAHS